MTENQLVEEPPVKTEAPTKRATLWFDSIPWFITIACTVTLAMIGSFLIDNIDWFKESAFAPSISDVNDPGYRTYVFHLHLSMIKRSVGLFSGFAIMFLGLGVAFYTLKDKTDAGLEGGGLSMKIASSSPGLVALIVGGYLIIETIKSKDDFPGYTKQSQTTSTPSSETKLDASTKPSLPKP